MGLESVHVSIYIINTCVRMYICMYISHHAYTYLWKYVCIYIYISVYVCVLSRKLGSMFVACVGGVPSLSVGIKPRASSIQEGSVGRLFCLSCCSVCLFEQPGRRLVFRVYALRLHG